MSLSNEIYTGTQICRIGKSTSFFGFYDSTTTYNHGAIFYYNTSNNTITALNTDIAPTTYENSISPSAYYDVLRPRGEKSISMIYNTNSDDTYIYDLSFDVW